jgi:hypothetical protein
MQTSACARGQQYAFDHSGLVRLDGNGKVTAKPSLKAFRSLIRRATR